jgi:hypothetical protein
MRSAPVDWSYQIMNAINTGVVCGKPALVAEMKCELNLSVFTSPMPLRLVIDAPPVFALMQAQYFATLSTMVMTDNIGQQIIQSKTVY